MQKPLGCYRILDTSGRLLREEPAPVSLLSYHVAQRQLAAKYRALNEIQQGPNPLTPEELSKELSKGQV